MRQFAMLTKNSIHNIINLQKGGGGMFKGKKYKANKKYRLHLFFNEFQYYYQKISIKALLIFFIVLSILLSPTFAYANQIPAKEHIVTIVSHLYIPMNSEIKEPWDVNRDFKVDKNDFEILRKAFGYKTGSQNYDPRADINSDGIVDGKDLILLAAHFGEDYRFEDYNNDEIPNIVNKYTGTSPYETISDQLKNDATLKYIYTTISSRVKNGDPIVLFLASKTFENAFENYLFNSPPLSSDKNVTNKAGIYNTLLLARYISKYDLLKGLTVPTGIYKLKDYISWNMTMSEWQYFYKLIENDVDIAKDIANNEELEKCEPILKSFIADLYLSQIKDPEDQTIVKKLREITGEVYFKSTGLDRQILNEFVMQPRAHNWYNDPTLAYLILEKLKSQKNDELLTEIYQHPKTFLIYLFDIRILINFNNMRTQKWGNHQLEFKNVQEKLKNGEINNVLKYTTDYLNSVFNREKEIDKLREQNGASLDLEKESIIQLIYTFNPISEEEGGFIDWFSRVLHNYHELLKYLLDKSNEEDEMFLLIKKYYSCFHGKEFNLFGDNDETAMSITKIFEQNFVPFDKNTLPYDLNGKMIQDTRDFSELWNDPNPDKDYRGIDFDRLFITLRNVFTPNNGYHYYGVCQHVSLLSKETARILLTPIVTFEGDCLNKDGTWRGGHLWVGVVDSKQIESGIHLIQKKSFYRFDFIYMNADWLAGFGDNFFKHIANDQKGTFFEPKILVYLSDKNPAIHKDTLAQSLLEVVNKEPKIKTPWQKFIGNVMPLSEISKILNKNNTLLIAFLCL